MAQTGLFLARCRFDRRNKRMLFSELIQCTDASMIEDLNMIFLPHRGLGAGHARPLGQPPLAGHGRLPPASADGRAENSGRGAL